jgi:hypothetical protein
MRPNRLADGGELDARLVSFMAVITGWDLRMNAVQKKVSEINRTSHSEYYKDLIQCEALFSRHSKPTFFYDFVF